MTPPRDDFLISLSLSVPRVAVNNTLYSFFLRLVIASVLLYPKMKSDEYFSFVCLPPFFNKFVAFYFLETCNRKTTTLKGFFYRTNIRDMRKKDTSFFETRETLRGEREREREHKRAATDHFY